jgi:CubicO group peptidase (beta-lactamase class C family)
VASAPKPEPPKPEPSRPCRLRGIPRSRKGSVRFSPARVFDLSFPSGGAGLAGTARDYLVFLEALRTGGAPMLKPETARAMTENQVGTIVIGDGETIGFGVGVVTDPVAAQTPRGRGSYTWGGIYGTGFWVTHPGKPCFVVRSSGVNHSGSLLVVALERGAMQRSLQEKEEIAIASAHYAGMAEIANDVLHNVGNILNSVKVSCAAVLEMFAFLLIFGQREQPGQPGGRIG